MPLLPQFSLINGMMPTPTPPASMAQQMKFSCNPLACTNEGAFPQMMLFVTSTSPSHQTPPPSRMAQLPAMVQWMTEPLPVAYTPPPF